MVKEEDIIGVLKTVNDPELMIDVWSLGLIYEINIDKKDVHIKMTFTTPMCPYGPMLLEIIEDTLKDEIKEIENIELEVVFDPPWTPSDELRAMFGV